MCDVVLYIFSAFYDAEPKSCHILFFSFLKKGFSINRDIAACRYILVSFVSEIENKNERNENRVESAPLLFWVLTLFNVLDTFCIYFLSPAVSLLSLFLFLEGLKVGVVVTIEKP